MYDTILKSMYKVWQYDAVWDCAGKYDGHTQSMTSGHPKYGYRSFPEPVCIAAFPALKKHCDGVATQMHSREALRTRCNELE